MLMERSPAAETTIAINTLSGRPEAHVFEKEDILAVEAALLSERPLLLRGEPGVGKSQLALAAAAAMKRKICVMVIDSRTEARDLLWSEDLVARLAQAQLVASLPAEEAREQRDRLDLKHFVLPGPLWWGFNWGKARKHANEHGHPEPAHQQPEAKEENGVVVLIDEIDKADSELPNGLLEAMGAREFKPNGFDDLVFAERRPLVVVTTNEERPLPAAFLRRCVVHELRLPDDLTALKAHLVKRGRAHFKNVTETFLELAADMTVADRSEAKRLRLNPLPGQAEYVDLLTAVFSEDRSQEVSPEKAIELLAPYYLRKHPELRR